MEYWLAHVWAASLIFVRLGGILMLAPGWGESFVPVNFRLVLALMASGILTPIIGPLVPPAALADGALTILHEALIGIMFGAAARLLMGAMHIAGQSAALHSGLALAQQFDPNSGQSGATLSVLLSMLSIALVLGSGLHHLMLRAAVDSYVRFPPGFAVPMGDVALWGVHSMSAAFELGIRIAAPVIAFSLLFNMALGIANRLIPQVQIFFVALPSSVMLGLAVLALGMGGGMLAWLEAMHRHILFQTPA